MSQENLPEASTVPKSTAGAESVSPAANVAEAQSVDESAPAPAAEPTTGAPGSPHSALLQHLKQSIEQHRAALHLASTGKLTIQTLCSTPAPARDLFPLAHVDHHQPGAKEVAAWCEKIYVTASWEDDSEGVSWH